MYIKRQLTSVYRATAWILILTIVQLIVALLIQSPELTWSREITSLIIFVSCFFTTLRRGLNPFFAWMVGYSATWMTLVTLNTPIFLEALSLSPRHVIGLLLISPLSYAIVAVIGSVVGFPFYLISLLFRSKDDDNQTELDE